MACLFLEIMNNNFNYKTIYFEKIFWLIQKQKLRFISKKLYITKMQSQPSLPVSKFMVKNIISVKAEETIKKVAKKMYENHVGAALVLKNGVLDGIVTHRDIATAVTVFDKPQSLPVSNIMSSPILHVTPEESIIKVAEIMTSKNIRRLAVVDQGKVIGIISSSDLTVLFSMSKEEDLKKVFGAYIN